MLVLEFATQVKHLACDKRGCGNRPLCHMPITLARRQLARVASEFRVVEPGRWLCIPHILGRAGDGAASVSTSIPWYLDDLTPFEALAGLERAGAACGAVDVHYTGRSCEVYAAYLYWLAGVAIAVITRCAISCSTVVRTQLLDTSGTLETFIRSWRRYAQVSQAYAHQMPKVLFG